MSVNNERELTGADENGLPSLRHHPYQSVRRGCRVAAPGRVGADARSRGACWDIHAVSTGSGHVPQATAACEERSNTKVEPRKRPVRFPDPRQTAAYFACQVLPAAESAGSKRFLVQLYSVSLPGR